jgi:hypothetical protein
LNILNTPYAVPFLRGLDLGSIPETVHTPQIIFPKEARSQRVAEIVFLCLWFLDKPIRDMVVNRSDAIVAGWTPQCGGDRVERDWLRKKQAYIVQAPHPESQAVAHENNDGGRCYCPMFNSNGSLRKKGLISVYATSNKIDNQRKVPLQPIDLESKIEMIEWALEEMDPIQRDIFLSNTLVSHVDRTGPFKWVPRILCHEIGHMISLASPFQITTLFQNEMRRKKPALADEFAHFAAPREAQAELIGAALSKRLSARINAPQEFKDIGLETIMPYGAKLYKGVLERMMNPG